MNDSCELNLFATNTNGEMLDENGKVTTDSSKAAISNLYTDLMGYYKNDRGTVVKYWCMAHNPNFITKYKDSLEFDSQGEVTTTSLVSLINDVFEGDVDATRNAVEFNSKRMNAAINSVRNSREQLKKAIELATSFNNGENGGISIKGYSALVEYKDPNNPRKGYQISIVPTTSGNRDKFEKFMKHQNLLERVYYRLAQAGFKADFLQTDSNSDYVRDLNMAEAAHTGLLTIVGLSASPSDLEQYNNETISQTARLLLDTLESTDPERHALLLASLREDDFIEYYGNEYNKVMLTSDSAQREVAANLIAKALKKDNSRKHFSRVVSWFLNRFRRFYSHFRGNAYKQLMQDKIRAYSIAERVANSFMKGKYAEALSHYTPNFVYSKDSPIGTPKLNGDHKLAYEKIVAKIRQLTSDMIELNPSLAPYYEELQRAVEHDAVSVENRAYDQLMAVQNIIDACRRLSDSFTTFWEKLAKLDFENQGSPVDEVAKYKTVREIKQFIAYVREVQHILDELLVDRNKTMDVNMKNIYSSLFEARKQLDNFLTSKNIDNLSLKEVVDRKEAQCVARFLEQTHGREYIEIGVQTLFRHGPLTRIQSHYRFFDSEKAKARARATEEILDALSKSADNTLSDDAYSKLSSLAKEMWNTVLAKMPTAEIKHFLRDELEKFIEASNTAITEFLPEEISFFDENMRSMSNNPDLMGQLLDRAVKQGNSWANKESVHNRDFLEETFEAWRKLHRGGTSRSLFENAPDGSPDGYMVSEYNTGKWAREFEEFRTKCINEFYELYPAFKPKTNFWGDNSLPTVAAKIAFNTYFRKEKAKWHREHSHFDETIQQWRPGKKVYVDDTDNVDRISAIFGDTDELAENVNLGNYDNTASENMRAIEGNSEVLADRDAGQYRGTDGSAHVRLHRLLEEPDSRMASIFGDSPLNGEFTEQAIESQQRGSRADEFLRVLFENKGQDIQAAKDAANNLEVDIPEGFPLVKLDDKFMDNLAADAIKLMKALASRGIKWSARNLRVNTTIKGLKIAGEMDLLLEYPDGTFEPWDFKTSKWIGTQYAPEKNENYKTQLNFYNRALKDKGYQSRVGGLISIDSKTGKIEMHLVDETSVHNWRVTPFELRETNPEGFSFESSVATQLELEKTSEFSEESRKTYTEHSGAFSAFSDASTSSENVVARPEHRLKLENISRQQALHVAASTDKYEEVKWAIDKEGKTPYEALREHDVLPTNVESVPQNYVIDPTGEYTNDQYENLTLEERKILKSLLDLKWEKDSQYPTGAVKYAMAPQIRGRSINKMRNKGGFALPSVVGHNLINLVVADADDYDFGDDTTHNGDEEALLANSAAYNTDRIRRMPVLGVNPIIDKNWQKKLTVHKRILDLYDNIERVQTGGAYIIEKNSRGVETRRKRTPEEVEALIEQYRSEIDSIAKKNHISNPSRENISKEYQRVKKRSASEMSTEIFHSMLAYCAMSNRYLAMSQICDVAEMGSNVIAGRKVGRNKGSHRSYSRWKSYLEKEFYNVQTQRKDFIGLNINKILGLFGRFASTVYLKGRVKTAAVNTGTGLMELFKEAHVGQFVNPATLRKALAIYFGNTYSFKRVVEGGEIALGQDFHDDFLSLFIEKFNTQRKNYSRFQDYNPEKNKLLKLSPLGDRVGYAPFEEGDRIMQSIFPIMFALETQVYDTKTGKYLSLFDAYKKSFEEQNKSKKWKRHQHKTLTLDSRFIKSEEEAQNFQSLNELKTLVENFKERGGEETLDNIDGLFQRNASEEAYEYYNKYLRHLYNDRIEYIKRNNLKNKAEILDFIDEKIRDISWDENVEGADMEIKGGELSIRMHGIYNTIDKVKFQQDIYGNSVLGMRGYLLGAMEKGFYSSIFNTALNEGMTSEWVSFAQMLVYTISGAIDSRSGEKLDTKALDRFVTAWKASIFSTMSLSRKRRTEKRYKTEQYLEDRGFGRGQYYANRRRQIHVMTAFMLTATAAMLKAIAWKWDLDDDDLKEEKSSMQRYLSRFLGGLHYILYRVGLEQKAYITPEGMSREIPNVLDVMPIAGSSVLRTSEIAEALINEERYQKDGAGYEAGDLKGVVQLKKMTPWLSDWMWAQAPWTSEAGYIYFTNRQANIKKTGDSGIEKLAKKILDSDKQEAEEKKKEEARQKREAKKKKGNQPKKAKKKKGPETV